MLLFIALANAANFAFAGQPGIDGTPHGLHRLVNFFMVTFVDSRAYPVFAVMFGYGLVQLARRTEATGASARRILLRRNAWLIAFGLVHATLLYFGDFLGAYGIVGIIATLLLLRRGDRFHRIVVWLWALMTGYLAVVVAMVATQAEGGHAVLVNTPNPSLAATSYGQGVLDRLAEWPAHTATVVPFIFIVWLGIWAGRRRILEDPAAHRVLLRRTAIGCLAITLLGALPYALVAAGVVRVDPDTLDAVTYLHAISGEYGGPGYVALFGLLALRFSAGRRRPVVSAVAALGQRSLSGYLFQSVAWTAIFMPFALDLGGSTYIAVAAAVTVWAVSVLAARAMDERGYRGPAERVLRRLTYRPIGSRNV
ncbi:DUF418 domain-containing protein [Phytohabitans rumicis]|uniref:DUF418 domain-containing protein n=2 Tax=Phytohabitans rumicis TaxID=1076125 RepID=A0A6V8LIV8_9ACTN|nr:DUF418 domain-containing protein [Phytohabitans rumicis]GFJ94106.1 hypothetical protein Prum_077480 [Phytohabitans rumicis]